MNPTEEDWKKTAKLVDSFYNKTEAEPFRVPVDWKGLGLIDYPKIIKEPMDLGTIKNKLTGRSRGYNTIYQVGDDVNKVWDNCKTYNADGSDFYKLAESLQKKWNDKFGKLLEEIGVESSGTSGAKADKVTLQDRKAFAQSLFTISKEDLGKILVEVQAKCPAALTRNREEDECELNIDKLPGVLLTDLMAMTAASSSEKKKKKSK